jgi:hypothetical protein
LIKASVQRSGHVLVGRLVEADLTVADLNEAEVRSVRAVRGSTVFCRGGKEPGRWHAASHRPQKAGAGPGHAAEKTASIDSIAPRRVGLIGFGLDLGLNLLLRACTVMRILHGVNPPRMQTGRTGVYFGRQE